MAVLFGERLFGKVDVVPGRFHVATNFFHIWFFPFVPFRSYLVGESGSKRIPLSLKSVLFAWLRALVILIVVIFLFGIFISFQQMAGAKERERENLLYGLRLLIGMSAGGIVLLWATYRFSRASANR